jgi:hypothetical protein
VVGDLRSARPASDPGRLNGRGLFASASRTRIPIQPGGRGACVVDDERNYKTDDDAEKISFW